MSNVPIRERLKSFVLRKGRITSNQKKALIDLKDQYLLNEDSKIELFNDTSVALDIGLLIEQIAVVSGSYIFGSIILLYLVKNKLNPDYL